MQFVRHRGCHVQMIRSFSRSFALIAWNTSGNVSIAVQLAAAASPWNCKSPDSTRGFERLLNTIVSLADPSSVRKGGVTRYSETTKPRQRFPARQTNPGRSMRHDVPGGGHPWHLNPVERCSRTAHISRWGRHLDRLLANCVPVEHRVPKGLPGIERRRDRAICPLAHAAALQLARNLVATPGCDRASPEASRSMRRLPRLRQAQGDAWCASRPPTCGVAQAEQ
jgi:hypothetical protein